MKKLIQKEKDKELSKYLKALSHPVRLSIIRTLMENSRCPHGCNPCTCGKECDGRNCKCGCTCGTLVEQFDMSQSTISQHIKELKSAGLINIKTRKGDYTINHHKLNETLRMLQEILETQNLGIEENKKCCV